MTRPKADPDLRIILRASRRMAIRLRKQGVEVKFNMSFGPAPKANRKGKPE
jgi:hypothetical protein